MVSPEVDADQRRGAVMFPAGLWRAADRDALGRDHLKPLWRLLPIQGDGAAIKPQISQTACREKGRRRKEKQRLYYAKRHTKTAGPQAKSFMDTHLQYSRGVNSNAQTNQLAHLQTDVHMHKHTNSLRLSCQHGLLFCRIFSLLVTLPTLCEAKGLTHHLNTDQCH